jgi:NADH-quinone oxidoreductase subunit F
MLSRNMNNNKNTFVVGLGTCGIAAGAKEVYEALVTHLPNYEQASLDFTSCNGMCFYEPIVEVNSEEGTKNIFSNVGADDVPAILKHIYNGEDLPAKFVKQQKEVVRKDEFNDYQTKLVLQNCGVINPEDIEEYLEKDGYQATKKVLSAMTSEEVIAELKTSQLKGRGGAGFSTGMKWEFAYKAPNKPKYMICNADEGDPGAFMDRAILEGDPHAVLEGMIIGGYAMGANEGYIYVRAEYPLAIKRLTKAINQAKEKGFLGKNILKSKFDFEIKIKEGAGAFVCGEETALIASIEGKRGTPRLKPPFPAVSGLWEKPTNINNVETLASVSWIINNGAQQYADLGTPQSKGTKVFSLAGKIKNSGLVEVKMGTSLRDVLYKIGGGSSTNKAIKAVQMGGPSGGCIPEALFDTVIDYEALNSTGAIMGSGGMVVMDEDTCMVDTARYFLSFTQKESCGKCTFCRIGTKRMLEILERITAGQGVIEDIAKLEELSEKINDASLCQLGKTAPNPVLTTLRYFKNEYLEHIEDKKCKAGACKPLTKYEVIPDKCTGCTLCARKCPVQAISGERKAVHFIDQEICTKCGICYEVCNFEAIKR